MTEKRRDNKGRILRTGESQRTDGRYLYKYVDDTGTPQCVYAWKLVPTDKTPAGKRDKPSLRELEKEIQKDLADGIDSIGKKMTLCQLYAKQNASRSNVKKSTTVQREQLMEILKRDKLGNRSIDSIKPSDAKEWAVRMKENGYSYQTINNYKRSLKASFYIAIEDDYVRKNPFNYALNTVIEDDRKPREALTEEQEEKLLAFVESDKTYQKHYDAILLLLKTGLRISEFCGLTVKDLDFENRIINVDHQLLKNKEVGYYIETPKTKSGIRQVPMSDEACMIFRRVLKNRRKPEPIIIDGYSDFVFLNQQGYPMTGANYTTTFGNLIKKYNKHHEDYLPNVTPHILRHTFCTRLANKNMNPKSLQYIMGHSNINITLNLYAHASIDGVKTEMLRLIA
ncbi:site-specific integrase [Clostridioides difficile]|uniref:site-specific integrase n=3 Tax=Clostridioides difficile TaxID=1496 RepID=UPI000C9C6188|nr:site-specific integrase [Clostridioides difficile]